MISSLYRPHPERSPPRPGVRDKITIDNDDQTVGRSKTSPFKSTYPSMLIGTPAQSAFGDHLEHSLDDADEDDDVSLSPTSAAEQLETSILWVLAIPAGSRAFLTSSRVFMVPAESFFPAPPTDTTS